MTWITVSIAPTSTHSSFCTGDALTHTLTRSDINTTHTHTQYLPSAVSAARLYFLCWTERADLSSTCWQTHTPVINPSIKTFWQNVGRAGVHCYQNSPNAHNRLSSALYLKRYNPHSVQVLTLISDIEKAASLSHSHMFIEWHVKNLTVFKIERRTVTVGKSFLTIRG